VIGSILRVSWINLKRDRVALALTFLLPVLFFSVFALVFGGMDRDVARDIRSALVVEESSSAASQMREVLMSNKGMKVVTTDVNGEPLTRAQGLDLIQAGQVDVAMVIPSNFSTRFASRQDEPAEVLLFTNAANPIAEPVGEMLLQAAAIELGLESYSRLAGQSVPDLREGLIRVRVESALEGEGKRPSIAFFAAGIGIMFLLFAVSGRSAILIEERESGVLTRLLSSELTLRQLLFSRWLFLAILGFCQVGVMFVWASIAFGLDLWSSRHLAGFVVMTAASAAAAAAFGLLLASVCRSRAQLNGVSSVLILVMSAVGGSMFPRFLMPEQLQRLGLLTFNAWALDGYQKIFWYDVELPELYLEVGVLLAATVVFFAMAVGVAKRWQTT
jgi:ABC-2 type transport system permease protein